VTGARNGRGMADRLKLTFADGSSAELDVPDGEAALKDVIEKTGDYKAGWIKKDDHRWLNLATVVEVELRRHEPPSER
jgi:hypothetical protein